LLQQGQRRLAAILAADVAGYSRLMAADESGTLAWLKRLRAEVIEPQIAQFQGRIVGSAGDSLLVEFASAVNAVQCAIELQERLAELNAANLPEDRRMTFRMGVNLGDVIAEDGTIHGDGVNIASRLEKLAEPGSVSIGRNVYEQVRGKLNYVYADLGEQRVHNIPDPVHVYRVKPRPTADTSPRSSNKDALPLPDKPSIAVLPFENMSSDREQDFFADGITEDLITALSRIRELFVISRNSSFVYKGRVDRLEHIARELGVRFILEGSIRVAGKRVRVTAQLIDGLSGCHIWAERFDGALDDIFGVQDEITRAIALALQIKLTYGDLARLWEGQTQNLRAWEKMALARNMFLRFNKIDNRDAQRTLQEALRIDPNYTGAMIQLGLSYWWEARFDTSVDKSHCLQLAEQEVEKVLALNPEMGSAYMLQGGIAFLRDQHEQAVKLCRKGIDLAPGDSWAQAFFGLVCIYAGDGATAAAALKTAMRLSPHYPAWYTYNFALANLWLGKLAAAQEAAEAYLRLEPNDPFAHTNLATVYGFQQRAEDAARTVSELREKFPEFGIEEIILSQRYKERDRLDRVVEVLRNAGLPD
jgi:adenylate cyclase